MDLQLTGGLERTLLGTKSTSFIKELECVRRPNPEVRYKQSGNLIPWL